MRYRAELAIVLLALGVAARIVALPLPASTDMPVFALWADTAAGEGVGRMYGTGGVFPERRLLERNGVRTKVNYPPLVLYEFAAARTLHLPLKALSVVSDAALAFVLWLGVRPRSPRLGAEWTASLGYWLNPAAILTGSVLGYVEPLAALPATAAVVTAASGQAVLAGVLLASAVLTKQLAVLVAPAMWLALGRRQRVGALAGAALASVVICGQVAWSGGALNMAWSLAAPLRDPFLSGDASNLWWLIGQLPARVPLEVSRAAGAAMTIAVIAWSLAAVPRRAPRWAPAAAAALAVHAYGGLAGSVHEAHLFLAVPLLALAAADRRAFRGPFLLVSAIVTLTVPRIAGPMPMALLSVTNCAALVWHAHVYRRETNGLFAPPESPSPQAGR